MLHGLKLRGHQFSEIIDIGASDGRWSRTSVMFFPEAIYSLIEPNKEHFAGIKKFLEEFPTCYHIASAGASCTGHIKFSFDPSNPFGGVVSHTSDGDAIPCISVDDVIGKSKNKGSVLLKLDTHGYEIPILEGATKSLSKIDAIIMECYTHRFNDNSLNFWEICSYMDKIGYMCIDSADPLTRGSDQTLWQIDLLFVKKQRPECLDRKYS